MHHSLTSLVKKTSKKQLRSCIMDDHLFLNLRTVCSRLVTVGEIKISYFLYFLPLPLRHSHLSRRPASAEDGETSAGDRERKKKLGKSSGRGADVRPHLALFSVCDKRQRFLHLADRSILCSKSAACLPSLSLCRPPPCSAWVARLGNCHIQGVSQMRSGLLSLAAPSPSSSRCLLLAKSIAL